MKRFFRALAFNMLYLGIDFRKILALPFYAKYRKDKAEWLKKGGVINKQFMILSDYFDDAGISKGHYFHQDLLVAKLVYEHNPKRHLDIGSRVDGFVAHVASYREIEVLDLRPLEMSVHENIIFRQADFMKPQELEKVDSLSCLHAIEHFGLGRYSDPIDVDGHNKGIANLVDLVETGGRLYLSVPISKRDEIHFNAHRLFHPETILQHPSIDTYTRLIRFDFVDDNGDLFLAKSIEDVPAEIKYGCGIYTFERM